MKDISALLQEAVKRYAAMSPDEQEAMFRRQAEGVAKAEASWKSDYRWENGVKVYDSYEDYCS